MNDFKVGDWVRHNGRVLKVVKHTEYSSISSTDSYHKVSEIHCNDSFNGKFYKLWQPQQGEWCWFYTNTIIEEKIGILRQFTKMEKDIGGNPVFGCLPTKRNKEEYVEIVVFYPYCEPFIGELPSFIKDK